MNYNKLTRWGGILNIVISALFLLWWVLMGVITVSSGTLSPTTLESVRLNGYQLYSLIGLIACILAPIGFMGLYLPLAEKVGKVGLSGFLLSSIGVSLYGAMQYDETFTWPVLAVKAPALLGAGGLMSDAAYMFIFLFMGLVLAVGFLLFGLAIGRSRAFPRWAVLCFAAGGILFGIGIAIPIRTLGLILMVAGWGWMGYLLSRTRAVYKESPSLGEGFHGSIGP
jgi:hypothetical protein